MFSFPSSFLCFGRVQVNACVHTCVFVSVRDKAPYHYPRSLSLYPLLASISKLKIFCQAHSFDHNSAESRSSLRVQSALGAQSAATACQPIKKKHTQTLLNTLLHHILLSSLISSYYALSHWNICLLQEDVFA